jgi:predicted SAM-dependent methyltransferase
MANDQSTFLRRVFPTAHKLMLDHLIGPRLRGLGGDVLVIGAGKVPYRRMMPSAKSLCCTDIAEADGIDLVVDAHSIPFEQSSFDAIVAIEVFEHLREPQKAAAEIYRVLREGGSLLVTVPFMFHVHGDPFDYHRFTKWGLEELFKDFSSVRIIPFGNRLQVFSDIFSTTCRVFVAFRIINHLITLGISTLRSLDCPSGYIVELRK